VIVYVRRRRHVSTAATSRHAQRVALATRHHSVLHPTSLLSSSISRELRYLATMAEATTDPHYTNRTPDNRSPTAHLTRRHRGAVTRRPCHKTTLLNAPCDGSVGTFGFPLRTKLGLLPTSAPPANRRIDLESTSATTQLVGKRNTLTLLPATGNTKSEQARTPQEPK
jgi:hypothetical protein